jgi:4-diphosphocytidyl-2-C-methyl-D-erythritol kinase
MFQTVGLWDELRVEVTDGPLRLSCSDPGLGTGADNLVMRAAKLLREQSGCTLGAHMHLVKQIPLAAGLAGGSGDAAATLIALNELWELGLDTAALGSAALSLGSDVPYCLRGGTAVGTGRGEVLESLAPLPACWAVLVHPSFAISTASVFAHTGLVREASLGAGGRSQSLAEAIEQLRAGCWARALYNRLEVPVFSAHPELAGIKARLVAAGAAAALMSGSGPTVFGLCANEAAARRVAGAMAPLRCSAVCFVSQGVVRQC